VEGREGVGGVEARGEVLDAVDGEVVVREVEVRERAEGVEGEGELVEVGAAELRGCELVCEFVTGRGSSQSTGRDRHLLSQKSRWRMRRCASACERISAPRFCMLLWPTLNEPVLCLPLLASPVLTSPVLKLPVLYLPELPKPQLPVPELNQPLLPVPELNNPVLPVPELNPPKPN
jgi:hypothetical protein